MKIKLLILLVMGILLIACGSSTTPEDTNPDSNEGLLPTSAASSEQTDPYPAVNPSTEGEFAYPPVDSTALLAYPTPGGDSTTVQQSRVDAIPFKLNKPIVAGATQVSGTGVATVPIMLVNVTKMGDVLGSTMVDDDGTFSFEVQPISAGERIGLMIGDLTGTSWKIENFYDPGFNGDEAVNVPMIGYFWDTAMVIEN